MSDDRDERMWNKVLNRIDDLERLVIQSYRGVRKAMTQLDTDIQTLGTQFAQDTADQQELLSALTTAINNSTADSPNDDPAVQSIITAMQANHNTVTTTLANLGIIVPGPSPTALKATAAVKTVATKNAQTVHGV